MTASRRLARLPIAGLLAGLLLALFGLAGCNGDKATPKRNDAADAYSAIIGQLLADRSATTTSTATAQTADEQDPPSVFVEPLGDGYVIDLTVQAAVVQHLEKVAEVRFIDNRAEALLNDEPGQPVRNAGLLVSLGPLVSTTDVERTVQVRRYVDATHHEDLLATVTASAANGSWTVVLR